MTPRHVAHPVSNQCLVSKRIANLVITVSFNNMLYICAILKFSPILCAYLLFLSYLNTKYNNKMSAHIIKEIVNKEVSYNVNFSY